MDATKIFTVLCAFLLIICLTLSITSLVVMRHAVSESEAWLDRAEIMVGKFDTAESEPTEKSDTTAPVTDTDPPDAGVDVLYHRFCLREVNGKIGVYTEEGYLVRMLDVAIKTLSERDQAALAGGIWVNSWRELIERIEDYE